MGEYELHIEPTIYGYRGELYCDGTLVTRVPRGCGWHTTREALIDEATRLAALDAEPNDVVRIQL